MSRKDWSVWVEVGYANRSFTEEDAEGIAFKMRDLGAAVAFTPERLSVQLTADNTTARTAVGFAINHVQDEVRALGIRGADVTGLRLQTFEDMERELLEPLVPELIGVQEAAEILEVSKQRVAQLATEHTRFPRPVARLASGQVWTRAQVESFAAAWERKVGRPRSQQVGIRS